MESRIVTREEVIELVRQLPGEKLAVVYDFIAFIQARVKVAAEEDDWLSDNEEAMAAEDARWEQARAPSFVAESQAAYSALRAAALAEIEAGSTQPMFDEAGRFVTDQPEQ